MHQFNFLVKGPERDTYHAKITRGNFALAPGPGTPVNRRAYILLYG